MTLLFALWLVFIGIGSTAAADPVPSPPASEIKGDVLYWEGEELVVREISGHEVRVRVTPDTKIQGASGKLKTGDKILATMAPNGPATSITLQIPDNGAPPPVLRAP